MTPKLLETLGSLIASSPPSTMSQSAMTASIPNLDLCIQLVHIDNQKPEVKEVYAHRTVLASKSTYFRAQLEQLTADGSPISTLTLDLSMIKSAVQVFQALLVYLYTEEIQIDVENVQSLHLLAKMFDLPDLTKQLNVSSAIHTEQTLLDNKLLLPPTATPIHSGGSSPMTTSASPPAIYNPTTLTNTINTPLIPQFNPALCAAYLQLLQQQQQAQGQQNLLNSLLQASIAAQQQAQQFQSTPNTLLSNSSIFPPRFDSIPSVTVENSSLVETRVSESEQSETRSLASSCSSANQPNAPSPPFDNLGDLLIPSNDKEGWCRNKKFIETVPNGYRCTICNKVYGRYNSVSYHVTIYHRNPPIKCEEPGCQFTTRESRYIYFHRYYRHGISLPTSIDTASRKCPFFSCRHVSKSPAMLEKHISRHVADCSKNGRYDCPNCEFNTTQHREMFEHLRLHQSGADCEEKPSKRPAPGPSHNVFPCDQCNYKGRTLSNLEQHRISKHHSNSTLRLPAVSDENLKGAVNPMPIQPSLDAASLNLVALKSLFPDNLFAMFSSAAMNAKP